MIFYQILKVFEARYAHEQPVILPKYEFCYPDTRDYAHYDLGHNMGATSFVGSDMEIVANRLSEKVYLELMSMLNRKQREIFKYILHSIVNMPEEHLCLFITVGAGDGKSVVIRTLHEGFHRFRCPTFGQC